MNTKLFCNLFGICLILLLQSHYATAQDSEEDGDDDSGASSSASCNSVWSSWSKPSACSDICGSCGTQTVTRTCTTLSTCPCSGKSSKPVPCGTTPCMYPRVSCCKDYKAMALGRKIVCGLISRHRKRRGRKLNKKKNWRIPEEN
ncbi:hypothetical protein Ddc_17326 [Ditylenchus destructor]|nr:hypothetical protein Ddc_17326 [Ditylenchus destructor]